MNVVVVLIPEVSSSISRSYSLRVIRIDGRVDDVVFAINLSFSPLREFGTIGFLVLFMIFYRGDFIFSAGLGNSRNALFGYWALKMFTLLSKVCRRTLCFFGAVLSGVTQLFCEPILLDREDGAALLFML